MFLCKSLILLTCFGLTYQDWSYDYETQWPRKCQEGTTQSPINIMTRDAVVDHHGVHIRGPLVFSGHEKVQMSAKNNGHTLQWSVDSHHPPHVSGGPLRGSYYLLQFHIHWLSEHAIDGKKFPLEIHLVHVRKGLTVDEALLRPDGLAVIGILCEVHSDDAASTFALQQLMDTVPAIANKSENAIDVGLVDVRRLVSSRPHSYYTYHGSLTTPSCEEAVVWILMDHPLIISDSQFKSISDVNVGGSYNYRSLQRSDRVVYRAASAGAALRPGLPALLAAGASLAAGLSTALAGAVANSACVVLQLKRKLFGEAVRDCAKAIN